MTSLLAKRPRGDSPASSHGGSQYGGSQQPECSPHRQAMLMESPACKRTRAHAPVDGATPASSFMHSDESGASSSQQLPDSSLADALRQRVCPQTGEVLFSMEQVRDIVRRAVDEKERSLREQYDRVLQQKLQEQYQAFAKFNEDYISRSLKTNDLSYCS